MALIDILLNRLVKRGVLTLTDADGKTRSFGTPDPAFPNVAIRFNDKSVALDLVRKPKLGMAEAYMDGRVDILEGGVWEMVDLISGNNPWEKGKSIEEKSRLQRTIKEVRRRYDRLNDRNAARRNVAHHYDLSDRLYDLFLDRDKQYSCAYFLTGDETLEQAQEDKKAHIAAKLALSPGMKVLDIGCGWGGMALYLHKHFGVDVLGVTLSEEQLKVAQQRAQQEGVANHVRFELVDYRDVPGPFDRIVSVGMFEHVGLAHYPEFFQHCKRLLTDEGVMLLHTIGRMGGSHAMDPFTRKYTFPGAYVPALSEMMAASEGTRLFATDVEVLRIHYGKTLRHWYDRTLASKDKIVALYDERFFRMWTLYLAGAAAGFLHGGTVNYQIQYSRDRRTLPLTRDYMVEGEAALRASGS